MRSRLQRRYEAAISRGFDCVASGRPPCRAASSTWTSSNRIPTSCMSRRRPAACTAPPTTASPGRRCSSAKRCTRSATSPSTSPIPTSSGSAPASAPTGRASSWGDGIYKTTDGGKTWTNVGLKTSMHIGRIVTHPSNPAIVYVAAQGSVWGPGGERGALSHDGRRQDVAADAARGRRHRRHRRGDGLARSQRAVCRHPISDAEAHSASTAAAPAARCGRARMRARRGRS